MPPYARTNWVDGSTLLDDTAFTHIEDGIVAAERTEMKDQPLGYAGLDASGHVSPFAIPPTATSVPTGASLDFRGAVAPAGFLLEDGSAVSRVTYAALYAVIGVAYGNGDGSSTFNLPDSRGRVSVGRGTNADVAALGQSEGAAVGARTPRHNHTNALTLPPHVHSIDGGGAVAVTAPSSGGSHVDQSQEHADLVAAVIVSGNPTSSPAITGTVGVPGPADAPAYLVATKIIKT